MIVIEISDKYVEANCCPICGERKFMKGKSKFLCGFSGFEIGDQRMIVESNCAEMEISFCI